MVWRVVPKFSNGTEPQLLEDICTQVLKFCKSHSLKQATCIHSPIIKVGLQDNLFLNNNLLSVYAKSFGLEHARQFFDEMPRRDVVSWTGLLSACAQHGNHEEALELYDMMKTNGQYPNEFTLSSVLRSCCGIGEFNRGIQIQAYMIKHGFDANPILSSCLIEFYSKWGCIEEAFEVFSDMDDGDTISWTTMISSFVQAQKWNQALQLYMHMIEARITPNEYTFAKLLSACSFNGRKYGKLVHAHLVVWGVKLNLVLKTSLVDMYFKCLIMEDALKASDLTADYDVYLWSSIISGFVQNLKYEEAFSAFQEMVMSGIVPNNYTYSGVLNACSSIPALELGEQIHSQVLARGLEKDVSVGNALVDMYMKCSNKVEDAMRVFSGITSPNVISWTSLIAGLAELGFEQESYQAFEKMLSKGEQPNSYTLSSILGLRSTAKPPNQTKKLHAYIIKTKEDDHIAVANALVDAYAASGLVADARCVITLMSRRDAITYTSLATRINQMGYHEEALNVVTDMHDNDIKLDDFSLATFLSASAGLGAMEPGKQLHCYSIKSGLGSWISVANGLVDLYGKCGCIHDVHVAFREISEPDAVSWNGLMFGLASNGHISAALSAFEDMRLTRLKPDSITFLLVLFACSHGGLADLGLDYFQAMRVKHDIVPQSDHYACLVDLLGRAGRLEEAMGVIDTLPFQPDALIYKTLLSACKLHGNIPLGEDVARRSLEHDPSDSAIYVLLANMYDDSGLFDLGEKTRRLMRERGLRRNPGQSWMELQNKVHVFNAGERTHPQISEIHERIKMLIAEFQYWGYSYQPNEDSLYHSEKLAVAFGLLNAPSTAPIRIIKNIPFEIPDFPLSQKFLGMAARHLVEGMRQNKGVAYRMCLILEMLFPTEMGDDG
ncbi:hypothetical protein RJ639_014957 [Escallonia herrerae]|uniref:DYW domain-containing protein n=1 Tax=Escallonia herrerae TaxID=1293975 RepID=A0AA88VG37_9ASTE|nr:hypothetical protein RJ639_014957 [Escallonia herrerae]